MCGQASRWAASLAIDYFTSDNYSMELLSPSTPCTKKLSKKTSSLTPIKGQTSFSFTQCSTPNPTILSPSKRNTCDNKYSNKSTPKSDRFIPNRSKMDFSYCNYNLLYDVGMKENEEDTKSSQPQGQTTNKLKEDLFQLANYTPGKRMLSCFDACDDEPVTPAPKVS